ncbi:unnamed protein product [Calypogeia fissa]
MADWQEAVQASMIALIFALMVAKLVSVVISFRGENLRVERESPEVEEVVVEDTSSASESENWDEDQKSDYRGWEEVQKKVSVEETGLPLKGEVRDEVEDSRDTAVGLYPLVDERATTNSIQDVEDERVDKVKLETTEENLIERDVEVKSEAEEKRFELAIEPPGELSDSDGWEGVESSELDERFGAAAAFVATQAVGPGLKVSSETQLLLYGLYKIATEGPCSTAQPSAYKMSARAKWNSWQKLGSIGSEEAMHRYIAAVSEISPTWAQGIEKTDKRTQNQVDVDASQRGGMGPVFSSLAMNEEGEELLDTIHICARDGDQARLHQQIEQGTPVDLKDSDGRIALHWAVDRGHLHAVELLLAKGAQINAKDSEGQTPLHYATTCEREEIAQYLMKKGAEPSIVDNDGVSPLGSRPGHWFWMGVAS